MNRGFGAEHEIHQGPTALEVGHRRGPVGHVLRPHLVGSLQLGGRPHRGQPASHLGARADEEQLEIAGVFASRGPPAACLSHGKGLTGLKRPFILRSNPMWRARSQSCYWSRKSSWGNASGSFRHRKGDVKLCGQEDDVRDDMEVDEKAVEQAEEELGSPSGPVLEQLETHDEMK